MSQRAIQVLWLSLAGLAPAAAATLFVDSTATGADDGSSWTDAYVDLQSALAVAVAGDDIWVAAVPGNGYYKPSVPSCVGCASAGARHVTFRVPEGVKVYGGFAGGETSLMQRNEEKNVTILSGDLDDDDFTGFGNRDDNAFHVVTLHNVSSATKLSGFRITAGRAVGDDPNDPNDIYDRSGSAVLVVGNVIDEEEFQSSPHITRCRIDDNWSDEFGGGVAVFWETFAEDPNEIDPVRLVNCSFHGNIVSSKPPLADGYGGGLSLRNTAFEVTNCVFDNNDALQAGGGVFATWPDDIVDVHGIITNSTFSLNKGPLGGAVHASDPYTDPNDVVDPIVALNNSICWEDDDYVTPNVWHELYGDLDVSFSDIQKLTGTWPSISYPGSNINADPDFCDASAERLGLEDTSPCIDAGLDPLVPDDNADVNDDGTTAVVIPWDRPKRPRLIDIAGVGGTELVDMGAFELPDPNCPWDLDGNGSIGLQDLALLLSQYGQVVFWDCPCAPPDFDCDGTIDLDDLTLFLAEFGESCGESLAPSGGGDMPDAEFIEWARNACIEDLMAWRDEWLSSQP